MTKLRNLLPVSAAWAAVLMIGGTEIMRELDFLKTVFGSDFDPTQYRMLLFGLAMVLIMIWKPRGLIATRAPSILLYADARTASRDKPAPAEPLQGRRG